jgi:AcrR family transcriptional regulator/DNA-binding XRE family transcriptional regulator
MELSPVTVGSRIRHTRGTRGITLREMAVRIGVSPATVSAVENGRTAISGPRLTEMARALGVSIEDLLSPVDGEKADPPAPAATGWRHYEPLQFDVPLTAALDVFLEVGYHGATMRQIAGRAGLSVPGIYHHYASKQEMLVRLFDAAVNDLFRRCELVSAGTDDCVERFQELVENFALFHTHRRELAFVGASEMRSLEEPDRSRIMALRSNIQRFIDDEVRRGHDAGIFAVDDPREAARAVVTMCTGLTQWYSPAGADSAEDVACRYVGYALGLVRYRATTTDEP